MSGMRCHIKRDSQLTCMYAPIICQVHGPTGVKYLCSCYSWMSTLVSEQSVSTVLYSEAVNE